MSGGANKPRCEITAADIVGKWSLAQPATAAHDNRQALALRSTPPALQRSAFSWGLHRYVEHDVRQDLHRRAGSPRQTHAAAIGGGPRRRTRRGAPLAARIVANTWPARPAAARFRPAALAVLDIRAGLGPRLTSSTAASPPRPAGDGSATDRPPGLLPYRSAIAVPSSRRARTIR